MDYLNHFGFAKKPFSSDLKGEDLLVTDQLRDWAGRFNFVATHKLWAVLTGEVGAGKSTAVRWALHNLPHPEYRPIEITACGGSVLETYRKILIALGIPFLGNRAKLHQAIVSTFRDIASQKITPLLIIDEASLLSLEAFKELHTLTQFDCDSKTIIVVVLVGQDDLIDKLTYPASRPLASRITARMHLASGNEQQTADYIAHHLKIAGVRPTLFEPQAITATYQASGGIPRNINNLARCALITAAAQKRQIVTPDDIRVASTELFLHP